LPLFFNHRIWIPDQVEYKLYPESSIFMDSCLRRNDAA